MRFRLVAAAMLAFLPGVANSADITLPTKAPVAPAPFTWTGFYVGGNAGYAWNSGGSPDGVGYLYGPDYGTYGNGWFDAQGTSGNGSFTGGIQFGYNYQVGTFVVGLETDLNFLNAKETYFASSEDDLYEPPEYNYHLREQLQASNTVNWFGTIRARLGVTPTERLLTFVTGGAAYGQVKGKASYNWHEYGFWWGGPGDHFFDRTGGFSGSDTVIRWGWTVGAGAEYAITNNITIKAEYLYVDLGSSDYSVAEPLDDDEFVTWSASTKLNIARVGVNYKF